MPAEHFLFLPLNRIGQGSGHMRRCFEAAKNLSGRSAILIDDSGVDAKSPSDWAGEIPGFPGDIPVLNFYEGRIRKSSTPPPGFLDTLAVFDSRESEKRDLLSLSGSSTPILIDDNGSARNLAPFLLDTIPGPRNTKANESSPSWLNLPGRSRDPDPDGRILVSFGGDDPSGLTRQVTSVLLGRFGMKPERINITLPGSVSPESLIPGVSVLDAGNDLKEHLADFGLVICSYGLTAWEALSTGCAVLAVDPTEYHAMLSSDTGIPGIGVVKKKNRDSNTGISDVQIRKLEKLLNTPSILINAAKEISGDLSMSEGSKSIASLLSTLEAPKPCCAACGFLLPRVIFRFPRRSYYRCPECGMTGLYRFQLRDDEYGSAYFEQEYRNQYGRSYLEDFQAIRTMAKPRLKHISRRAGKDSSLLDIGCAFGPFLDAAREAGFRPYGTDVSEEACAHVREVLSIPAAAGRFPADNPAAVFDIPGFHVISLWYVIEHFAELKVVLEALNQLLFVGGVLALSTPNATGISGRRSMRKFLENSPKDHYTVWNPLTARKLLERFGFKVYKFRVTGHHPERFAFSRRRGGLFYIAAGVISRLFGLGDTFEIYAVKERSLG